MKESVMLSSAGQPARPTRLLVVLAVIALAVVALGAWVYANHGLGMLWCYSTLVTALAAFLWFAPYARTCDHPGEGTIAVWLALFLGPLSLIALVPWMTGLAARFEAERGSSAASAQAFGPPAHCPPSCLSQVTLPHAQRLDDASP